MGNIQRKFDFVAILLHGTGRTAMQSYLLQCDSTNYIQYKEMRGGGRDITKLQKWLDSQPHKYLGLILDLSKELLPRSIVDLIVPNFPLLLVSRDPIGTMASYFNFKLRLWADTKCGLFPSRVPIKSEGYKDFPDDYIKDNLAIYLSLPQARVHKIFAALRMYSGSIVAVEFSEFCKSNAIPTIMQKITTTLFQQSNTWSRLIVNSHISNNINTIFDRLPPFKVYNNNNSLFCSVSPYPCEFFEFRKYDVERLAISYSPESIAWQVGEFNGNLGLYCKPNEINSSTLSMQNFVHQAGILLKTKKNRDRFSCYVEEISEYSTG